MTARPHQTSVQRDWQMIHDAYHLGRQEGLREGLSQGPSHPAVVASVERMFGDWAGAEVARQRSTLRFWDDYRERDAA